MSIEGFKIKYHKPGSLERDRLIYVIIGARTDGKWIFVRHRDRQTWELPAGHIEEGESPDAAARRELYEETGTIQAHIRPLFDYTVETNGRYGAGRLYLAEVIKRADLPESEIGEIQIAAVSPEPATYPEAHRSFLKVLDKHIR